MRNYTSTDDFSTKDFEEVCRRAAIFQNGLERGENFTHVCPGIIIATEFFQESSRTSASLQAAITKLGGGWFGISGIKGTYLDCGEEDLDDTLFGVAPLCDLMAVRHKTLDLTKFAKKGFPVPLINAMSGDTEHSLAGISILHTLKRYWKNQLKGKKIGIYGMTKSSRPAKAYIKVLSRYKVEFIEDSVVPELATPRAIQNLVKKNKSSYRQDKLANFIKDVDALFVLEGLPQAGEDPKVVKKFNDKFVPLSNKHLKLVKPDAYVMVGEPRATTDGRLVSLKETDSDPRVRGKEMIKNIIYCNMALITYLLDVKIK